MAKYRPMTGDYSGSYDRESILFFDVAHEGAHIRAIVSALERLEDLRSLSPRSIVVLAGDQLSYAAAQLAITLQSPLVTPAVVTKELPRFVGALDVVIGVSEHGDQPQLAQDLIAAHTRGAITLAAVPASGPLADDISSSAITIPPPTTAAGFSPARVMFLIDAVFSLCAGHSVAGRLSEIADAVDEEVALLAPDRPIELNPARNLREFIDNQRILHTGVDPTTEAVARFASELFSARGFSSGFAELEQFPDALGGEHLGNPQGIFHDPFLDNNAALLPLKTVVWAGTGERDVTVPRSLPVVVEDRGEASLAIRLIVQALAATVFDPH